MVFFFFKFVINVWCDRYLTNSFEIFLKTFEVPEWSVNEDFYTNDFEMNFAICGIGKVNVDRWHF